MTLYVAPIVEGQTEALCLERLLQKTWTHIAAPDRLQVLVPARGNRSALVNERHPALADKVNDVRIDLRHRVARDANGRGLILILLDAEKDCPARLGPRLLARARAACGDVDIACVLPTQQLENWFVAAAESLRGACGLPDDVTAPDDPEVGNGAAWLTEQMRLRNGRAKYKKPGHGTQLVAAMNLAECRRNAPSFDKLCRDLEARVTPPGSGA